MKTYSDILTIGSEIKLEKGLTAIITKIDLNSKNNRFSGVTKNSEFNFQLNWNQLGISQNIAGFDFNDLGIDMYLEDMNDIENNFDNYEEDYSNY